MVPYTSDPFSDLRRANQNSVIRTVILCISNQCTGSAHFVLFQWKSRNCVLFSLTLLSEVIFMRSKKR